MALILFNLPIEVWMNVVKYATTDRGWAYRYDLQRVQGFIQVFPQFKPYLAPLQVRCINLRDLYKDDALTHLDRYTRHLTIGAIILPTSQMHKQFWLISDKVGMLTSPNERIKNPCMQILITAINNCSAASLLQTLDLCVQQLDYVLMGAVPALNLPKLLELRLRRTPDPSSGRSPGYMSLFPMNISDRPRALGLRLATMLSSCRNLQFLHLYLAMDNTDAHETQWWIHRTAPSHARQRPNDPLEDSLMSMYVCSPCRAAYDHNWVASQENITAHVLAEKLPNLSYISFMNIWTRYKASEPSGQRGIRIVRMGPITELRRDDGRFRDLRGLID